MSKGGYDVNDPYVGPSKDASFRSCICAMLVFISICGIILIVTTVLKTSNDKTKDYPDNTHAYADSRSGNKESNDIQKTTERIDDEVETVMPQGVDSLTTSRSGKINLASTTTTTIKPTTKTTERIDDEVETVMPQGVDSLTTSRSGKINLASTTTTTIKPTTKTTERIDDEVETVMPQGVDSLTTSRSGKINLASTTTTTIKPVPTKSSIQKTDNPLKILPETTTLSQTANLSTNKPVPDSVTSTQTTIIEGIATTQNIKDDRTTQISDTTTDNTRTQNTQHKQEHDQDKSNPIQSATQETTTENSETTTQNPQHTSEHDVEKEENDKSINSKPVQPVTEENTTENTETTTENTETTTENTETTTENTETTTETTTQNIQHTSVHDVEKEENDKSIYSKPAPVPQETTTENTDTTTIQQQTDVATESEDSLVPNNSQNEEPTTQPSQETTTESKVITLENNKNKQLLGIGNQDKLTTDSPETTTENTDYEPSTITSDSDILTDIEDKKQSEGTTTIINQDEQTAEQQIHPIAELLEEQSTVKPSEQSTVKPTELPEEQSTVKPSQLPEELSTFKLLEEVTTKKSTFKRLTPPPLERASTIIETDDTFDHRSTESQEKENQADDPCGKECKSIGASMLSRMNHSGDACEHFYDYACGGDNIDNTPEDNWKRIADGLDRINPQSPEVYKTFKRFYQSCVDFHVDYDYKRRVEEAIQLIEFVGQASVDYIGEKSALTDLLTQLLMLDSSPLFDISVDVDKDSQDNQNFIFQLNLGKQFSTFSDKYTSLTTRRKCLQKCKKSLEFLMPQFNAISLNEMYKEYLDCKNTETYKLETVEKALDAVGMIHEYEDVLTYIPKILDHIKSLPSPAVVRKNIITRQFETRKVSEMELHYPSIEWKQLLTNLVGKEVQDEDKVQVYFKDFFTQLFGPKTELNTTELHEAILGMYAHDLYTNYILPTPISNPEEFCLQHSSDLMKEVASSLFLQSIDPENTNDPKQIEIKGDLKRIEDLFTKMKSKMSELIYEATWVDFNTRNSMARKLDNMEFDSWNRSTIWRNMTIVEDRMKGIGTEYNNYSNFTAALVHRNRKLLYSMWQTVAYKEENVWWHFITPYSTSPKSTYSMNRVFVPPGALLTKSEKMPKYLSLVKLGFKLAKSIAHHFDYFGSRGFTRKTKEVYNDTKACILQSYFQINGTEYAGKYLRVQVVEDSFMLSLNDRYAEDLAITLLSKMSHEDVRDYKITWLSENKNVTTEKLFFIALGQEHCKKPRWEDFFVDFFESEQFSTPLLLDNSLSHLKEFSEIFECYAGSRMNPDFRCKPFPLNDEPVEDEEEDN